VYTVLRLMLIYRNIKEVADTDEVLGKFSMICEE
jgi:hypothetical protein